MSATKFGFVRTHVVVYFRSSKCASLLLCNVQRSLQTYSKLNKEVPTNLKGKSTSSHNWLTRQLTDPYVERAKMSNYRCRSAFKLLEMDDKYHFLDAGQCVIDCGAAPGSWTQILVERTNALGKRKGHPIGHVIGIDRNSLYPVEGAILLNNIDFTSKEAQEKLQQQLQGRKVNVVLSDMAPNASGVRNMDHEKIIHLAYCVLRFSVQVSVVRGTMLLKIWDGQESQSLENDIRKFYAKVKNVKPKASRVDSAEKYILARDFKGLKT